VKHEAEAESARRGLEGGGGNAWVREGREERTYIRTIPNIWLKQKQIQTAPMDLVEFE
jgi:hypothetical protein